MSYVARHATRRPNYRLRQSVVTAALLTVLFVAVWLTASALPVYLPWTGLDLR